MRRPLILISAILFLASCSDYNKVSKSKNPTPKFKMAVELYYKQRRNIKAKRRDYERALPLLEQLRETYRGHDSMEIIYYYTAYCNYGVGDYEFASLYFKDFVENFSSSPRLVECAYMHVYCQFLAIGPPELDQSNTIKTIGALQAFINNYPNSAYVDKCNNHIDVLRKTLQKKQYETVMLYYKMGDYRATVVSCRNTLKSFPDMEQKEELEYLTVEAQYLFAKNSVEKKRLERYTEALENWKEYNYINKDKGKYYKKAEELKKKIEAEIKKLKETT